LHQPAVRMPRSPLLCWGILIASGLIYGSSFSFMKIAMAGGLSPLAMVFWFAVLATVTLYAVLRATGKAVLIDAALLKFCVPWGLLSVVFPNFLFFVAAREIPASIIAFGIAFVPILTLAGAIGLRRERLTLRRSLGISLGAGAILLILLPRTSLPQADDALFVLIAFAGAACYAAEHLYIETRAPQGIGIDQMLFLMFLSVSVLLLPVLLAAGVDVVPRWPLGTPEWAVVAVATVTLVDYFFITLLILWAGPVFTSQAAYLVTLAGVMWGMIIFGDSLSPWLWTAIGLLMAGLTLVRPRLEQATPHSLKQSTR
jgi:drug/metabolite transporter (DMT)-like permease